MDSEAVLKARLTEACLPEENVNVLLGKQITTLRKLAYSVCTPTATASDAQLNALVKTSETEEVGVAILAAIRQVHFEAQTLAVAALKNLVEPKKDSAATELPFVERNERIRLQKGRLQGLDLSGVLENAHSNYDLVFAMREQNSLKYLGPAKFPSRKQEVMQEKCLQELKVDSSGSIVFGEKKKDVEAELGTELLIRDALTRRALAFDLVGLCSFMAMESFHRWLFDHLQMPATPAGSKVTIGQVMRADKQAFVKLAEWTSDGIKRTESNDKPPFEQVLARVRTDPSVVYNLLQAPVSQKQESGGQRIALKRKTPESEPTSTPNKKENAKGKGKRNVKGRGVNAPKELRDKQHTLSNGERICWNFNLGLCQDAEPGGRCPRGHHVCAEPHCQQAHQMKHHPR